VDREINYQPGRRVFGISVNDKWVIKELDLGGTYGLNMPNRLRFTRTVSNGEGISIKLHPIKGEPVLSGVRIRKVRY
jgi:beta-galactosidase